MTKIHPQAPKVVVYTKPSCVQCDATKTKLDRLDVPYTLLDITKDPEAHAAAKALGYLQAPVVTCGDLHWAGYSPDKLTKLSDNLKAWEPATVDA